MACMMQLVELTGRSTVCMSDVTQVWSAHLCWHPMERCGFNNIGRHFV